MNKFQDAFHKGIQFWDVDAFERYPRKYNKEYSFDWLYSYRSCIYIYSGYGGVLIYELFYNWKQLYS